MTNTLVEAIKAIERLPEIVKIDRRNEYIKLLNEARRKYTLVDKAIRGEVSIHDTVEKLSKKYIGWRLLLPRFKDAKYDKKLDELALDGLIQVEHLRTDTSQIISKENPRIGPYRARFLGWFYDKIANPTIAPLLMGGMMALIGGGQGRFESEIANYSAQFGMGVFVGLLVGLMGAMMKYTYVNITREQAKDLQVIIQEVRPYM